MDMVPIFKPEFVIPQTLQFTRDAAGKPVGDSPRRLYVFTFLEIIDLIGP